MAAPKLTALPSSRSRLQLVQDPLEMRRLLDRAIHSRCKAWFQVKGDKRRFDTHVSDTSGPENGLFLYVPSDFGPTEFEGKMDEYGTRECLILMFLPGAALIGASCAFVERDGKLLEFAYPTRIFKIQRRREARLDILRGYDLSIEVPSRRALLERNLMDLSASGLSFAISSSKEANFFVEGTHLKDCRLVLEGREVRLDLIVRNQIPFVTPDGPGIKIGCSVLAARRGGGDVIAVYVAARLAHRVV